LDESSESSGFWSFFRKFIRGKNLRPIGEIIYAAREEGELDAREATMLMNVLRLGRKQVHEIMIPRTDTVCAELDSSPEDIARLIIEFGHSRIPIYKENKDNIVGIVHAKDLLTHLYQGEGEPPKVRELMRRPFFIPESKNVKDLLHEFQTQKIHLAIALDEYGGTSGLVTFEDVLEEIVGEIEDEHDIPRPDEIQLLENNDLLVSGRTLLSDLKPYLGRELDSEVVDTVGGYVCELAGRVPRAGESFSAHGLVFGVKEADPKQIRWIVIQLPPSPADE